MRISQAVVAFSVICGSASAFSVGPSLGLARQSKLFMADAVVEEAEEAAAPAAPAAPKSGMTVQDLRKAINGMSSANFSDTLTKIEPYLLNEAGSSVYAKSMKRIAHQANQAGAEVPAGYAKDAACTSKRRAKQDEFIQAKEAGRADREAEEAAAAVAAAEAAAAEATAAEEAAAEAAAAPAEEEAAPAEEEAAPAEE